MLGEDTGSQGGPSLKQAKSFGPALRPHPGQRPSSPLTPFTASPGPPAEVTRAEGNPATSLRMGCWGRKALWALGFLLLLGTSSAQDTWEALLPSGLVEKSRVSAGMGEEKRGAL